MKCIKKRYITLVEMMIVMFLIAMITGVIAYNYTGSLEEGKAFKTKAGMQKIETILALETSAGDIDNIDKGWEDIISRSPLVQNPQELIKDGWGNKYEVTTEDEGGGKKIVVTSKRYNEYLQKSGKSTLFGNEKKK